MKKRALTIVIFVVVFGLPIGWYLFLQAFGENKFSLPVIDVWKNECVQSTRAAVIIDSISASINRNEFKRIQNKKTTQGDYLDIKIVDSKKCNLEHEIYFIDALSQIRGVYDLTREDVDRLFAEIDIYILNQKSGSSN